MVPNETELSARQLDDVLEQFEANWTPDHRYLSEVVAQSGLQTQPDAIVELIRADIDRRYMVSASVHLPDYLPLFPILASTPNGLHAIAYEDFRSRRSRGLSLSPERWSWMPGIQQVEWYLDFQRVSREALRAKSTSSFSQSSGLQEATNVEPEIGKPFGDFQILAFLGSGTFSRVYLATQGKLASRFVAIKVVRKMLDEPTHLAMLQHTGIIPIYSLHRIGDYSVLCMPYYGAATLADWMELVNSPHELDGKSLVDTVKRAKTRIDSVDLHSAAKGTVSETKLREICIWSESHDYPLSRLSDLNAQACVLWLASRIAAALAHAHLRGVVHGDIKPANILLRNDGDPSLIDFNLAVHEDTQPSQVGGTLPYMAPEQLQILMGAREQVTAASDIYSLGLVLYQIIEGKLPYPVAVSLADSDVEAALKLRRAPVRWTSRNVSPGLKAIIQNCLMYEPWVRYEDGDRLLEDLEREAANLPLRHAKEPLRSRLVKCTKRYPRLFSVVPVLMASLLLLGLVSSAAFYWRRVSRQWDAKSAIREWRETMTQHFPTLIEGSPSEIRQAIETLNPLVQQIGSLSPSSANLSRFAWLPEAERHVMELEVREDLQGIHSLLNERESDLDPETRRAIAAWPPAIKAGTDLLPMSSDGFCSLWQARNFLKQNMPAQARELVLRLHPRPSLKSLYWVVLGDAERSLGHLEAAELSYGFLIRDVSHSPLGYTRRSQLFASARKWERADEDLTRLIALGPGQSTYRAERARIREQMGRVQEAIADLDAAIALEPTANRYYFFRSRLRQREGHADLAKADFQQGMRRPPRTTEDWISRALAQLPQSPDLALDDLNEAERLAPDRFEVHQNRAHVLSEHLHDEEAALASLEKILEQNPTQEWARIDRCVLLARNSRHDEALSEVRAIVQQPRQLAPSTYYQLACVHSLSMNKVPSSRDEAFRFLALALTMGYGSDFMVSDPDLELMRQDPHYQAMREVIEWTRQETRPDLKTISE